jgi:streptogramin lyase
MTAKRIFIAIWIGAVIGFVGQSASADMVYTTDEQFALGEKDEVNHDPPNNDQLQLNTSGTSYAFINVAASGRGTIVRINADSGDILGEYKTAPEGRGLNPSRTTVDGLGNVWTANRDEAGEIDDQPAGSAVKIGLIIGGTRVSKDASGEPIDDPDGDYLKPPFEYNTCSDRDEDGLIRTSRRLGNILSWPDVTDGVGGEDGIVEDAEDECILLYQRLAEAEKAHHVSVDADGNVWVGGYPNGPKIFYKLAGNDASVLDSFSAAEIGCGGFGGLVDGNGILWSADPAEDQLMYYDPDPDVRAGGCISITESFGLGIDSNGFIWNSLRRPNQIAKVDPNPSGPSIVDGFPKNTAPGEKTNRGVAVTAADDHVWLAKGFGSEITRLDNDGDLLKVIVLDQQETIVDPTGISVDANGKVWVANLGADNVMRIAPDLGDDELGAVDLTVELGADADPDNFSDMAGAVANFVTSPKGTWTVIHDGEFPGQSWGTITWNTEPEGSEPEGASITVEVRAADSEQGLEAESYLVVLNGVPFSLTGRFIQIRATLTPDSQGSSPVLSDLTVESATDERVLCDVDENGIIDRYDIFRILFSIGDSTDAPDDPRDWDRDGLITIIDVKGCIQECTNPRCKPKRCWRRPWPCKAKKCQK